MKAGIDRGLARRSLTKTSLKDAAHDALVDLGKPADCFVFIARIHCDGSEARTAQCFADDESAQLRSGEGLQRSLKLAYGGANCRNDDNFFHAAIISKSPMIGT